MTELRDGQSERTVTDGWADGQDKKLTVFEGIFMIANVMSYDRQR